MSAMSPQRRFDAALLDLDGTLLDTGEDLALAANRMLNALGLPLQPTAQLTIYIGKGLTRLVHRTLTGDMHADAEPGLFARAMPLYEKYYAAGSGDTARIYPGVIEGLEAFRAAGVKLAVVTNKTTRFTGVLLEKVGLDRWFELVVCGDTLARRKPDPLPFTHACDVLGVTPARSLVIGDSANDIDAGRAAGCAVYCVPYGYREGKSVESLGADRIVASLADAATHAIGAGSPRG